MATITNRAKVTPARTAEPCCCPACTGLECLDRTRFFAGQLLSEADLNNDQSYWLAKSRLHNRYLHGWGVVCGMQVLCGDCDGWATIKTGYAIDPCGNDVIVCSDQPFNVIQAIQACCTPAKTTNCSPPRSAPPPNCQDVDQQWCITIQYDEEPTRSVAPLRPSTSQTCGCGCGGSSKGGCGCSGKQANASAKTACCCSTSVKQPSSTPGCEPTRLLETFRLGVCAVPSDQKPATPSEPSYVQNIRQLMLQKPSLANNTAPAAAYTQVCNFQASIRRYLALSPMTHCQTETAFANTQIPKPGEGAAYISQLQSIVDELTRLLTILLIDSICLSLLPTCPPDPCTNCLVLACVTVRNGKIIDICHFGGGRRQLVTVNSLGYWLGLLGLDKSLTTITNWLAALCCGGQYARLFQAAFATREDVSAAGFTNPAILSSILSSALTEHLGATLVNAAVPGTRTVDLRPYVGLSLDEVNRAMKDNQIDVHVVEASPAWTDDAVARGQQFAPSAFAAGQPVTVYTRNQLVVGLEPTSPTDALQLQITDLQNQITALQNQLKTTATQRPKKG